MGFFDDLGKNLLGAAKTATTMASSYVERIEQQAIEREKQKQKEAEAENDALKELQAEKERILKEIQDEKDKLAEERRKLAESQSDPSFIPPEEMDDSDNDEDSESDDESADEENDSNENAGDLYPGTADDPQSLLDQLADMTAQQNELSRRLQEMGMEKEVKSIVGSIGAKPEEEAATFALEDIAGMTIMSENMTRQVKEALKLMMAASQAEASQQAELLQEAIRAIKGAVQAAADAEDLARDIERKVEEVSQKMVATPLSPSGGVRYDWKRKPVYISFGKPGIVYQKLDEIWERMSPGSKRDEMGNPLEFPKYTPYIIATGSSVASGYEVPEYALQTPIAFENWCKTVGFGEGVSLEIKDMVEKPGMKSVH